MEPFDFLYGRTCRTLFYWDRLEDTVLFGPKIIQEMEEQMSIIQEILKQVQDIHKSYVDVHRINRSYKFGDKVILKFRPQNGSIKFGKGANLSPWYVGPFKILKKKRPIAYRLAFPPSLDHTHDVFHILVLHHYILDPSHVIDLIHL
jgi:hypothetical protein